MKFILQALVVVVVLFVFGAAFQRYAGTVRQALFGTSGTYTVFLNNAAVQVTVATTPAEQAQGLSGLPRLPAQNGKLFVFASAGPQSIWMKDMRFPIDIMWFDASLKLVHVEESVSPGTYPETFGSPVPARFVLETNANFVTTHQIKLGDQLSLPQPLLPPDLQPKLQ